MINGGNASVYITDMDKAVEFYTDSLGLKLKTRLGNEWAEVEAGDGLIIGLHLARPPETVAAGTVGAINIELRVTEKMESVVQVLSKRGVTFEGDILNYENVRIASLLDPDSNVIILAEVLHGG
ncbi:VOC family protein [Hellea sp.]|nr:VOC family protein [Hellea sp.]